MYGGIKTGQATVSTTAGGTLIVTSRVGRGNLTIINHGATNVFVGPAGLTLTNGALLVGVAGASLPISSQDALFGLVSAGTQDVSYIEQY